MYISDWGYLALAPNEEQEAMLALTVEVKRPMIIQGDKRFQAPITDAILYHYGALSTEDQVKNEVNYKVGWLTHTFPNLYERYEELFAFLVSIECPFYGYLEYNFKNAVELEYLGAGYKLWTRKSDAVRDNEREAAQRKIYDIRSWTELEDLVIRPTPPVASIFKKFN